MVRVEHILPRLDTCSCSSRLLADHPAENASQVWPNKLGEVKAADKEKPEETTDTAELGTLSGSWFLINGREPSGEGEYYEVPDVFTSVRLSGPEQHVRSPSLAAISSSMANKKLRHHIRDSFGTWKPSHVLPHGRVSLTASLAKSAQHQLQLQRVTNSNSTQVHVLADTGAQMCVADWQVAERMNLTPADLLTPALTVSVADNASLELMGAQFLQLKATTGQVTQQLVYFAKGVGEFYLSKSALVDLQVIDANFPTVGACGQGTLSQGGENEVQDGLPSDLPRDKSQSSTSSSSAGQQVSGNPYNSLGTPQFQSRHKTRIRAYLRIKLITIRIRYTHSLKI